MNREGPKVKRTRGVPLRSLSRFVVICFFASCAITLTSGSDCMAQQSSAPTQPAQGDSSSQPHHSGHHVRVATEDDSSPPELTAAEAAIDKHDYASSDTWLRKL